MKESWRCFCLLEKQSRPQMTRPYVEKRDEPGQQTHFHTFKTIRRPVLHFALALSEKGSVYTLQYRHNDWSCLELATGSSLISCSELNLLVAGYHDTRSVQIASRLCRVEHRHERRNPRYWGVEVISSVDRLCTTDL